MNHVLTVGYSGSTLDEIARLIEERRGLLVDVRLKPFSRWAPQWNRKALTLTLGERYSWIQDWGNVNYKGGPVQIRDFQAGVAKLERLVEGQERIPILMCGCRDVAICHRKDVADLLATHFSNAGSRVTIEHIELHKNG